MLRWTHDHHRDVRTLASAPRTTALHSTNRGKSAVTRHRPPQFPAAAPSLRPTPEAAPSVVSDAPKPPLASVPTGDAIRCSDDSDRSHHGPRFPLPVVTSPRSAENRNTHRPSSAAPGFVLRRLSYAWRRPKLFTIAECRLLIAKMVRTDIASLLRGEVVKLSPPKKTDSADRVGEA